MGLISRVSSRTYRCKLQNNMLRSFKVLQPLSRNLTSRSRVHLYKTTKSKKVAIDPLELAKLDLSKANFTRLYQAYLIKSEKVTWGEPDSIYANERTFRIRSSETVKRIWKTFSTSEKFDFLSYGELEYLDKQQLP